MNYTYTGEINRVFVGIKHDGHSLKAIVGQTYDLDTDPESKWFVPSAEVAPVASSTSVEPPAASGSEPPSSDPEPLNAVSEPE